jgi:PAS domain-containing protein
MKNTGKRKAPLTGKTSRTHRQAAKTRPTAISRLAVEREVGERLRGLKFLYDVANISGTPDMTLYERYQEIAKLLPQAWHYPEAACARITINGREFASDNYRETPWKQSSDINVRGQKIGHIEICYLEERPELDEGPFSKEERLLLDATAERLETITEHRQAEEELRESQEFNTSLLENTPEPVVVFNPDISIKYANAAFEKLTGFSSAEITGIKPPFPWWPK